MIAIGGSIGTGLLLPLAQRFLRQVRAGHCSRNADWPDGLLPDDQSR